MSKLSVVLDGKGRLLLLVGGLAFIVIGNAFKCKILKVDVDQLVANVGALVAVIGLLQAIFDSAIREQVVEEVYASVTKGTRLREAGIADAVAKSRDVDYGSLIERAQKLVIGAHYSARFFEDYSDHLRKRLKSKGEVLVVLLEPKSGAAEYLRASASGHGDIEKEIARVREVLDASSFPASLKIKWHERVLRYTFVMADNDIWIRFFTNSEGFSHVPAIHVSRGGALFEFFESDVVRLLEQSKDAPSQ